jgi:gamma-glutamyltranspeptidase/glutathione hydrolase
MRKIVSYLHVWLLLLLVFSILVVPASSWARRPQETPGVPPGTILPDQANPSEHAGPPSWTGKAFRKGVVSVSTPLAAEVGASILENGGNAIDAAAAIQFALNVVEPNFSGIGGGGFMMIHLAKTGETFIVESREKAPAAATPDMFQGFGFTAASTSGLSVGVPGTLLGVATALENWGTISLSEAIEPAIELAQDGFEINRFLAGDTANYRTALQPETAAVFRLPNGDPLPEGYLLKQPDLAKTLRLIAEQGPDVFYRGEIAEAIVEAQKRTQAGPGGVGRMALDDLDQYDVKIREPIVGNYRGFTLKSMSPPSSGGLTVVQMLKMLERFPLGDENQGYGFGATRTLNVMIEAMRLAFADRAVWMGDEDFVAVPKDGLIDDDYIAVRSALIDPDSRISDVFPDDPRPFDSASLTNNVMLASVPEHGHTTHFSVVDKRGNVVSYTTTIEMGWGSSIMVPGYGFLLNNELTDFNFTPRAGTDPPGDLDFDPGANDVAPFKRPRSSMSPSILFKGDKPIAAYGSPGGSTIINSVFQITLNLIDHGLTIQEAIDAPRISSTTSNPTGSSIRREEGFSEDVIQELEDLGHVFGSPSSIGSVQAIVIDLQTGKQYGGADQRREGTVIGLPRPRNN